MASFGKATLRVAKNYTKGYSDVQAKVRDATSNDPLPPSGKQMNELAQMSYHQQDFVEIMEMLDKRLNDKGKNWRHVYKALVVLDYLLHSGSENVVIYFKENIYIIKTLKEFQYVDDHEKDEGANVRHKAKDITNLLQDDERLRNERKNHTSMHGRLNDGHPTNESDFERAARGGGQGTPNKPERGRVPPGIGEGDDDDFKKAIAASKRTAAEEKNRQREESEIEKAMRLSREEEAQRLKALEDSNSRGLFDEQREAAAANSNLISLADENLQPQYTQQLQPQFTSMAPQFTSFNPYQQQAEQEAMQAAYMQQHEFLRQQQEAQAQAQMQAQMQAQQEEWNRQQQQQQQMLMFQQQQAQQQQIPIQPTGFGSNNPFALTNPAQSPSSSVSSPLSSFSLPSTFSSSPSPAPPISSSNSSSSYQQQQQQQQRPTKSDAEHAHLANLFANREDGLDSFGNIGNLRFGHTNAGRNVAQQMTGRPNPFGQPQQQPQQQQQQYNEQPFFSV
ncbi:ENTH-domain-containing protein [Rickenella mellea]|uniref:ENTH-domain-containing protein n=1 Tax=Rickenella mellea TaxID=50990 RepID=A0A4Y7Q841_9AGAM|nr:ENTH-domain-containing protein [Rickenella mellea]